MIHSASELAILELYHNVEKMAEKIEDGCRFSERVLDCGNGIEVLSVKKHITNQLLMLLNNIPRLEPAVTIGFQTDADKFKTAIDFVFGHIKKPDSIAKKVCVV